MKFILRIANLYRVFNEKGKTINTTPVEKVRIEERKVN